MPQISNLSFDVRFEPHNPDRVGLIDTTPSLPAGYVGIFKVTQPDGYVREGNISSPDVNNVTRSVVVTLVPDSTGNIQQGQYVIEFTALAPGYLSTTFTRTFTFQYTPATVVLRNDFDLFTPSLAYTDISNYNVSGYSITTGPTRRWDVTSPTTGLITGTNSSIDIVYNNNYYAENYAIAFRVNVAYVSQAYPWLSITHTINTTATATACVPKSIEELTQAVDALRIESNQACGDDWSRFEKANALYTHLINMLRLVLVAGEYQEGFYDVYQQLLSLLQNGNTTCATIGQIIPPYDFSDYESSIYDGEASYCTLVGNGVNTVFTINHQLGDKCVVAQVYEVATGKQVICELAVVTINTIDVTFFEPPTTNQYRVVVVAGALGIRGQGLQPGGLDGQVLVKKSDADFDTEWADASFVTPLLVPYIGATGDVDLGEFGLKTGNIEFDTTPTGAPTTAGSAVWNDSDGTLDLVLKGGNTTIQVGQDLVIRVVNKTDANLLKSEYKAVRVRKVSEGGAQGQRLAVVLGQASTEMNSTDMLGIVTENIANNNEGFITTFGTVRGINTTGSLQGETWADGDILFLSPTVPGGITKVKPSAPNHLVIIGYVEYAHQNNGKIFVHVQTSWELDELHNVSISSPVSGQTLLYNQATGLWYNSKLSIEQLSDVFVSSPTPGQILVYTGGGWNNAALPASVTSVGLASSTSGVTITNTPVTGSGVININIATASSSSNGLLSSADWTTFNGKQPFITAGTTAQYYRGDKTFQNLDTSVVPENTNLYFTNARARQAVSLTTTGSSGAATYDNGTGVINIPQYTLAGLGGVPTIRQLTINGTAYDLSADRSWSVGTVTSVAALTIGSAGTDVNSTVSNGTTTPAITLNIPSASTTARGLVTTSAQTFGGDKTFYSNATILDTAGASSELQGKAGGVLYGGIFFGPFYQFNAYAGATGGYIWKNAATDNVMTLSQTGAFSLKTLIGAGTRMVVTDANGLVSTQAIPSGTTTGSGTTNYIPKWTSASAIGNSQIFDDGTSVGIGTSNTTGFWPANLTQSSAKTVISYSDSTTNLNNANAGLVILNTDSTANNSSKLVFGALNTDPVPVGLAYISATNTVRSTGYLSASLVFGTSAGGSTGATERMRIFANGRVAINTTSDAGFQLDVNGTARFQDTITTRSGTAVGIQMASTSAIRNSGTQYFDYGTGGTGDFYFRGGSGFSNVLTMLNNGNVGIGTTSPQYKTHILQDRNTNGLFIEMNNRVGAGDYAQLGFGFAPFPANITTAIRSVFANTFTTFDSDLAFLTWSGSLTEKMRITTTGNVGIGTTSPGNFSGSGFTGSILDVAGVIQIKGTSANTVAALNFGGDTYRKAIIFTPVGTSDPYLAIGVATNGSTSNASEYMRINSAGNVGIGTTAPNSRLHVVGDGTAGPMSLFGGARAGALGIKVYNETTAQSSIITLGEESGTSSTPFFIRRYGSTNASANVVEFNQTQNAAMLFYTNNTERARIAADGTITASSLSGTGTRMVVADSSGVLSTQSISGGVVLGSGTTNYVPKWTSSSGLGNSQIFDDGTNVGIGTATPISGSILDIVGSANVYPRVRSTGTGEAFHFYQNSNSGTTAGDGLFVGINSGNDAFFYNAEATPARFFTSATERLRIFANGRVGINTGATDYGDYRLQVVGAIYNTTGGVLAATSGGVSIGTTTVATKTLRLANRSTIAFETILGTSGGYLTSTNDYDIQLGNNNSTMLLERVSGNITINSGGVGNVGVGTVSPGAKLHVVANNTTAYVSTNTLTSGTTAYIANNGVTNSIAATLRLDAMGADSSLAAATISSVWTGSASSALTFGTRLSASDVTERMRIDANGNVGIGTTSTSSATLRMQPNGSDAVQSALQLSYNTSMTSGVNGVYMSFNNASEPNSQLARIAAFYEGGTYRGSLRFYTNTNTDGGSPTERMRIDSNGNVGINAIPSVNDTLIVNALSGDARVRINRAGVNQIIINHDSSSGVFRTESNTPLSIGTNGAERVRIFANGRVYIGSTPVDNGYQLDVNGTASVRNGKIDVLANTDFAMNLNRSGTSPVAFQAFTSNAWIIMGAESSSGGNIFTGSSANAAVVGSGYNTPLQFATNNVVRMTVNNAGNVGIGTTSPSDRLHVSSSSARIRVESTDNSSNSGLVMVARNGSGVSQSGGLYLASGATTQFVSLSGDNVNYHLNVLSSGNVGIGTITPQNYSGYKTLEIQDTNGGVLRLTNPAASVSFEVAAAPAETYIKNIANLPLWFGTNNTERMRITAVGNVGIGGSPLDRFTVIQDQNATSTARVRNSDTGSSAYAMVAVNASGNSWGMRMGSTAANSNALAFVSDALGTPTARMTITTAGNVGIGVTPSPWSGVSASLQLGVSPFIASTGQYLFIASNSYYNGTNAIYTSNGASAQYSQYEGSHMWYTASSGTAGNAVTLNERMRITAGGDVLIGTTTNPGTYKMVVNGRVSIYGSAGNSLELDYTEIYMTNVTNRTSLNIQSFSNTGSNATPAVALAGTWNTTGNIDLISANITNTASGSASNYIRITDGTNEFRVTKTAQVVTSAPTGGAISKWKLGEAATVSPTSPNRTLRVEIDGTVYYLHAKTTND